MPSTLRASRTKTLWSLATMLPEVPRRTLLYGIEPAAVAGLEETSFEPRPAEYDAAIAVLTELPDSASLREIGDSLRPGGRLLLAVRSGWSRAQGGRRFGTSPRKLSRLIEDNGYTVDRIYGIRPSLVLPEFVVCLNPGVSGDFWTNLFRPWTTTGALAAFAAGWVPAVGARSFPWLVVRARLQHEGDAC